MAKKPPEKIEDLFKRVYDPSFKSEDIDFKSFYHLAEQEAQEDMLNSFKAKTLKARSFDELGGDAAIKKPLTKEESFVIEDKKARIAKRALYQRDVMAAELTKIDEEAIGWAETFDLSKRPILKKAIKRVFGSNGKETITYDEFKSLLIRKKQLEVAEAKDMMKPEEDDTSGADNNGSDIINKILGS
jgi:hypothetical protein